MQIMDHVKDKALVKICKFSYDLSDLKAVKAFAADILKTFSPRDRTVGPLECLVNNAAVIDYDGQKFSKCGRYDYTMMVNVIAPFVLIYHLALQPTENLPKRIVTTSTKFYEDAKGLHIDPMMGFQSEPWSHWEAYCRSKLLVNLLHQAVYNHQLFGSRTTLINFCPGLVNTNMLIPGFGPVGKEIVEANDTFLLSTRSQYLCPDDKPKMYKEMLEAEQPGHVYDQTEQVKLFELLKGIAY
mmetsp:Transcript_7016/g.11782  ORF Transcript_7016/g.11782 Transcript_7016/m.11782 type:complete len:241 (-) Transcript_7016:43-765(-)